MSTTAAATPKIESTVELKRLANRLRIEIIKMIGLAASGHPGGSLSEVELLAALYFRVLRHNPSDPNWPDPYPFLLSKGHGCPALYAPPAQAPDIDQPMVSKLRQMGSPFPGQRLKLLLPSLA